MSRKVPRISRLPLLESAASSTLNVATLLFVIKKYSFKNRTQILAVLNLSDYFSDPPTKDRGNIVY